MIINILKSGGLFNESITSVHLLCKGLDDERESKSEEKLAGEDGKPPEDLPKVVEVPKSWEKRMGGRRVLVPAPLDTDAVIRRVRKGKLITVNQIREKLAGQFKTDSTCPMTVGIFLRIISEFAEEQRHVGKKRITPYWRVLKVDGSLNPKYPGGVDAQAERLKAEGHRIIAGKGKKPPKVENYKKSLV